jgi:hypothetical protein
MMIEDLADFEVYEAQQVVNDLEYEAWEAEYESRVADQMQADEDYFFESGRLWDSTGLYDFD